MINIAERIIKQMVHDKRSLAMILIVPLFLLTLIYLLLAKSSYIPVVATENLPPAFLELLDEQTGIDRTFKDTDETAAEFLQSGQADAVITQDEEGILHVTFLEMDGVKVNAVTDALRAVAGALNPQGQTDMEFVYGEKDQSMFDSLGFLLLGILAFFMIFLFSGISFVRERTSDTLERLMLTPVETVSVVGGYVLGFSVFALIQSILLILYARFVLRMAFIGQWWVAMLIMLLLAVLAVVTGVLVSAISRNEFQVMQFIPIIVVPQIFFSGLIPVDTLPFHLNYLSRIMPLYYGCTGLKGVLVYGYGAGQVLPQILVLLCFIAALFVANIFAVDKYRAA